MRRNRHPNRRALTLGALSAVSVLALVIIALYAFGREIETGLDGQPVRGDLKATMADARVLLDGVLYMPRHLTTILLMGVDHAPSPGGGNRNGGQADFIMLILIDDAAKTITPLQIDRDTMAEITVLGVLGDAAGTRSAQICLSHGFGDGARESCLLTRDAVENLLTDVRVDYYLAMNLEGIRVLNDAVGGVTVTLEDDFSALDPVMRKGTTLTLQGDQSEIYVRNRMGIGVGTNQARMGRQEEYLKGLKEKLRAALRAEPDFYGSLFDALEPYLQTDMRRGRIINESWKTRDYRFAEIVRPEGEYVIGRDGFMEFHADEAALRKLVVSLFYQATQ